MMATKKEKSQKKREKARIRVNMRLPSELIEWAKEYAEARNTTLTQIVVDELTNLQAENVA